LESELIYENNLKTDIEYLFATVNAVSDYFL